MKSHELAKILLENENLPVATHANNHEYNSEDNRLTHGKLQIGLYKSDYSTISILIGLNLGTFTFLYHNVSLEKYY